MKEISNKILKTELVTWKDLKFLQSENLKDLPKQAEEKLKQSILNNDFCQTFNVWQKGKDVFLLDGHHRVKILKKLEEEGNIIPDKFPANFIDCKNRKEACKLLLIYSSIYAKIEQDGLVEFLELEELTFDDLKFDIELPDMDFEDFEKNFSNSNKAEEELDEIPEEKKEAVSRLGDLFLIDGRHRVLCGDSTKQEDVERLMGGGKN